MNHAKKITAFLLAIALCPPDGSVCAEPPAALPASPAAVPAGPGRFTVPLEIGDIKKSFKGKEAGMVFIIQDAHAVPDAQRSIQKLIAYLRGEYGAGLVGLEGAPPDLDPLLLRSFPDQELLKKIFAGYFDRGEVSGGTAAAVFDSSPGVYHGIEDWDLYQEGLRSFLTAMKMEAEISGRLKTWSAALEAGKKKSYSPRLLEIDAALLSFHRNARDLTDLLGTLASAVPPPRDSELALLLEESRGTGRNDASLDAEVRQIAGRIRAALSEMRDSETARRDLKLFNSHFQEFQTSSMTPEAFALFLKELSMRNRIRVQVSGRLNARVGRQRRMRDIEGTRLFDDLEAYAKTVKEALFRNAEERGLDARSGLLELIGKLSRLELSREDWAAVKSVRETAAGKNNAPRLPEDPAALLGRMTPHFAFYENSEKRDAALLTRTNELGRKQGAQTRILVAGGFHAEGLVRRLEAEGVSYALIMPAIRSLPAETAYRGHMQGEVSWGNYFEVRDGRVSLYDAFIRATRDLLLAPSGGGRGRVLKAWRDQILRGLAEQGRLGEARDYTRFIDELENPSARSAGGTGNPDTGMLTKWRSNIDGFLTQLYRLRREDKISERNILGLFSAAGIPDLVTSPGAELARGTTAASDLIPSLAVRQEIRTPDTTWEIGGFRFEAFSGELSEITDFDAQASLADALEKEGMAGRFAEAGILPGSSVRVHVKQVDSNHISFKLTGRDEDGNEKNFDLDALYGTAVARAYSNPNENFGMDLDRVSAALNAAGGIRSLFEKYGVKAAADFAIPRNGAVLVSRIEIPPTADGADTYELAVRNEDGTAAALLQIEVRDGLMGPELIRARPGSIEKFNEAAEAERAEFARQQAEYERGEAIRARSNEFMDRMTAFVLNPENYAVGQHEHWIAGLRAIAAEYEEMKKDPELGNMNEFLMSSIYLRIEQYGRAESLMAKFRENEEQALESLFSGERFDSFSFVSMLLAAFPREPSLLARVFTALIAADQHSAAYPVYRQLRSLASEGLVKGDLLNFIRERGFAVREMAEAVPPAPPVPDAIVQRLAPQDNSPLVRGREIIRSAGLLDEWNNAPDFETAMRLFEGRPIRDYLDLAAVFLKDRYDVQLNVITDQSPPNAIPSDSQGAAAQPVDLENPEHVEKLRALTGRVAALLGSFKPEFLVLNSSFRQITVGRAIRARHGSGVFSDGATLLDIDDDARTLLHEFGHAIDPVNATKTLGSETVNLYGGVDTRQLEAWAARHGLTPKAPFSGKAIADADVLSDLIDQLYAKRRAAWISRFGPLKRSVQYYASRKSAYPGKGLLEIVLAEMEKEQASLGSLFPGDEELAGRLRDEYESALLRVRWRIEESPAERTPLLDTADEKFIDYTLGNLQGFLNRHFNDAFFSGTEFDFNSRQYVMEVPEIDRENHRPVEDDQTNMAMRGEHYEYYAEMNRLFLSVPDFLEKEDLAAFELLSLLYGAVRNEQSGFQPGRSSVFPIPPLSPAESRVSGQPSLERRSFMTLEELAPIVEEIERRKQEGPLRLKVVTYLRDWNRIFPEEHEVTPDTQVRFDDANRLIVLTDASGERSWLSGITELRIEPAGRSELRRRGSPGSPGQFAAGRNAVDALRPRNRRSITREEARRIAELSTTDLDGFASAVEAVFTRRLGEEAAASAVDILTGSLELARRLTAPAESDAGAAEGEIALAIDFRKAGEHESFFAELLKALAGTGYRSEIFSDASSHAWMSRNMTPGLRAVLNLRRLGPQDLKSGRLVASKETAGGMPLALDRRDAAAELSDLFLGLLFQDARTNLSADQQYANEALFAAFLVKTARILRDENHQEILRERMNAAAAPERSKVRAAYLKEALIAELGKDYPNIENAIRQGDFGMLTFQGELLAGIIAEQQARSEIRKSA